MKNKTRHLPIAIAACLVELGTSATKEIQLFPAGTFKARDGRPAKLAGWYIDARIAANLIEQANTQQDLYVLDYEHQTINAKTNGQPAPASGWFKDLEWREGVGLFAINVDWTANAAAAIDAKEYRYISPVFSYDPNTGDVTSLLMAAIVNTPAIDGMKDLTALTSNFFTQDNPMNDLEELLERLRYLFNLPTLATVDDIKAELDKLKTLLDNAASDTAAASIWTVFEANNQAIAALKSQTPDPAEFVPVSAMSELHSELVALKNQVNTDKLNQLVTVALSDGRLKAGQKDWAMSLSVEALNTYLKTTQPIAALSALQTKGIAPAEPSTASDTDHIVALATEYQHKQALAGKTVSVSEAVAFVSKH